MDPTKPIHYHDAGVSIAEADRAVAQIKKLARKTFTPAVLSDIGAFGASYALAGWKKPVLVSSADGVGTKLKIAFLTGIHDTIGEDLVNHCVNDIAVQGAVPLFFLDYFAAGKLDARVTATVITGLVRGCKQNRCALIGGETAEMPGLYASGEYDLAGFIVGAAERAHLITGRDIQAGDCVIGLASTGLHTNGYSLARKLLFEVARFKADTFVPELNCTVAEELLKTHRSYLRPIRELYGAGILRGAAHITGGGITENVPRILPRDLAVSVDTSSWPVPPIFGLLRTLGNIPEDDYRRTFNLGLGLILIIPQQHIKQAERILKKLRETYYVVGSVVARKRSKTRVRYR